MRSKRIWTTIAILMIQSVAVYWYCKSPLDVPRNGQVEVESRRVTKNEFQKKRIRDGGLPEHRKRIDDFIDNVAELDFQRCALALHAPTSRDGADTVQLASVSAMMEPAAPSGTVSMILADRRCARMFSLLKAMDGTAAHSTAAALFDAKLSQHIKFFARKIAECDATGEAAMRAEPSVLDRAVDPINPDLTGRDYASGAKFECATANHHALSVSLFLAGCFCSPREFLGFADQWNEVMQPIAQQIAGNPRYRMLTLEVEINGPPDPLLICNLMLMVASHRDGGSEPQSQWVSRWPELGRERANVVSFYAWDAETNNSDFTHVHAFVPTSEDMVIARFASVRRWSGGLRQNDAKKMDFYRNLRARFVAETGA